MRQAAGEESRSPGVFPTVKPPIPSTKKRQADNETAAGGVDQKCEVRQMIILPGGTRSRPAPRNLKRVPTVKACVNLPPWAQSFVLYCFSPRLAVRARRSPLSQRYPERPHRLVVREYLVHLHAQPLGRNSILRAIAVLRAFYKYLVREEIVLQSPFTGLRMRRRRKKLPHEMNCRCSRCRVIKPAQQNCCIPRACG